MAAQEMETVEAQLSARVVGDVQSVARAVVMLREETAVFQRSMYKNHSQHRRAFFYQHLQHVRRCLRDLKLKDVEAAAQDAQRVIEALRPAPEMHHIAWKALSAENKTDADSVLRRLVFVTQATAEIILAAQKAYKGLEAQFAMTYFMPFALAMNSVLARLVALSRVILMRSVEAHAAVSLLYLNQVTQANPLRARTTAVQLQGYRIPADVLAVANL